MLDRIKKMFEKKPALTYKDLEGYRQSEQVRNQNLAPDARISQSLRSGQIGMG